MNSSKKSSKRKKNLDSFPKPNMLCRLSLKNFRNHEFFSTDFHNEGAIITGANGSGKTSILEAIFILTSLRPFRSKTMQPVVSNGETFCEIIAETTDEAFLFRWQFLPEKKTALRRNGVLMSAPEILKRKAFYAVLFSPEELQLPFAAPRERRRFLNRLLIPLFPDHLRELRRLDNVIESRNKVLKRIQEKKASREELEFFDDALAESSVKVSDMRAKFFSDQQQEIVNNYRLISGSNMNLHIEFQPDIQGDPREIIRAEYKRDLLRGSTGKGAHHDDFYFLLENKPLQECGSRGEVRSALLALKLAERAFVKKTTGKEPVLLLDDVFSELDAERRRYLAETIIGAQSFVTATDAPVRALQNIDLPIITLASNEGSG